MTQNYKIFKLNNTQCIKFLFPCRLEEILLVDEINIDFYDEKVIYSIYVDDCISYALRCFISLLQRTIANKLQLHESIDKNIGYMWNQYLNDDSQDFFKIKQNEQKFWVGQRYLLWSSPGKYETWLYNMNDEIFLEITPIYRWHFRDPKEGERFIGFDEWIKNYKSTLTTKIDKQIAQEWLKQAEELLELSTKNYKEMEKLHNDDSCNC